jgi:DNA-binding transcriptional ArsR family regulator
MMARSQTPRSQAPASQTPPSRAGAAATAAAAKTTKTTKATATARTKAKAASSSSTRISLPTPDYEADDVLVVREREQLRALGDDLRSTIVVILREHAHSTTELADTLGLPKGTVAHHLKVLEKAGLVQVVRTRQVRAVTERYYGRTARLFLFENTDADGEDLRNVIAATLRRAAEEMLPPGDDDTAAFAGLRVRLTHANAKRLSRKFDKLVNEFRDADTPDGEPYGLALAIYRRAPDA